MTRSINNFDGVENIYFVKLEFYDGIPIYSFRAYL